MQDIRARARENLVAHKVAEAEGREGNVEEQDRGEILRTVIVPPHYKLTCDRSLRIPTKRINTLIFPATTLD